MANDKNLKRGNIPAKAKEPNIREEDGLDLSKFGEQTHNGKPGGYLAPPPVGGRPENFAKAHAETAAVKARVREDTDEALEEIHANLTSLTRKLIKRAERVGTVPDRATMDVIREFRQTAEVVGEARKARGAVAESASFFSTLDSRLEEVASRMEAGPKPVADLSA